MYSNISKKYDDIHSKKNYVSEINFICNNIEDSKSILDLGCGTGAHTIELSNRGYNIIGLDPSLDMIEEARKKNSNINFWPYYLHETNFENRFDCIISMFHVVNNILDINSLNQYFESISKALVDNGILIFDCFNQLATILDEPKSSKYNAFTGKMTIEYKDSKLEHMIWPPSILLECINNSGMKVERILKAHEDIDASKDDYKIVFKCKKI